VQFYKENPHQNYAYRAVATPKRCSEGGFVLAQYKGEIVGAGGIFPVENRWIELGQTYVTLRRKGIYRTLVATRILMSLPFYVKPKIIFAEVDETNNKVLEKLQKMCFEEFIPPVPLKRAAINTLPIDKRPDDLGYEFVWLKVTNQTILFAANYLKELITHKKVFDFEDEVLISQLDSLELLKIK
jgi:hypothetical protein